MVKFIIYKLVIILEWKIKNCYFYVTHIDKEYNGDIHMLDFEHNFKIQTSIKQFDFSQIIRYSR
jgi:hypothetical protein